MVRDPFGETGRSFALQTACTVALFLLLLVSATGSNVRSAPHTLCALCPSVTLHAPLSNASISAPLMSESCPSTTRNLKDFLGCFFVFRHDRACTKRSGKQKGKIIRSICVWYEIHSEIQDGRLPCKRLVLLHFFLFKRLFRR